jgi:hypothetical protein
VRPQHRANAVHRAEKRGFLIAVHRVGARVTRFEQRAADHFARGRVAGARRGDHHAQAPPRHALHERHGLRNAGENLPFAGPVEVERAENTLRPNSVPSAVAHTTQVLVPPPSQPATNRS